jgi:hypothetical protein
MPPSEKLRVIGAMTIRFRRVKFRETKGVNRAAADPLDRSEVCPRLTPWAGSGDTLTVIFRFRCLSHPTSMATRTSPDYFTLG